MCASELTSKQARALSKAACVRWRDPADELVGLARIAHALIDRGDCLPCDIAFAVPNRNWALQMKRALDAARLASTVCIAPLRISSAGHEALAALDMLADPASAAAREAYEAFGRTRDEACALLAKCGEMRGYTLIRLLGIDRIPDFAHALYHVRGDENADRLAAVLRERIERPAIPPHVEVAPILDYRDVAATGGFPCVFVVGCVNGLVPGPAAFEAPSAEARDAAMAAARQGFASAVEAATHTAVVSYFEKIDAAVAEAAHICHVRCKVEHGRKLAMCAPTCFLAGAGTLRPTTVGGQTFLRDFNLN